MLHLSTKTKKYLRWGLSGLLVTGMVLVTGFLSFTGALALNDSIYFAISAFFLAGGIEGEVFAQNISTSLLKIFTGNYLEDVILNKKLAQLIKHIDDKHPSSQFLTDYKKLLDYSAELEDSHDEANQAELKNTQRSLKWMRRHFKSFMMNDYSSSADPFHAELKELITPDEKLALRKEIRKKIWLSRLSWVLNLGAGLSCGLVGLEVAQSSILAVATHFGFAISGAVLSTSVFGLALVGAVGYTLLIHNTISSMIQNDTLQKWAKKTVAFFSRKGYELSDGINLGKNQIQVKQTGTTLEYTLKDPSDKITRGIISEEDLKKHKLSIKTPFNPAELNLALILKIISEKDQVSRQLRETNFQYALRTILGSLAVSVVVGLGVFATVATAGTWWYAAKAGAKMLPWISNFASEIRAGAVSIMGITSLIFNVVNSLKSAKELAQISVRKKWQQVKHNIGEYRKEENQAQFFNPIRIIIKAITIPFKLLTFIGHLVSMGIMGDKLEGVDPQLTTSLNTTSEFLTDFHIIFPEDAHQHKSHDHSHENGCPDHRAAKAQQSDKKTQAAKHPHDHKHENGHGHHHEEATENPKPEEAVEEPKHRHKHKHHDHTHTDLTGKFLKLALSPLYLLGALWDYGFSEDTQLTFKKALKKSFFGLSKKVHIEKPQLSSTWLTIEKQARVQKTIYKYGSKLFAPGEENCGDLETIDELRKQILAPADSPLSKRAAYVNTNGSINSSTFFNNRSMSKDAKIVCEKLIKKTNSSQYSLTIGR